MDAETVIIFLKRVRSPIANVQEQKGIPKEDQYSFMDLMTALCQHSYSAALTILTMLYNVLPIFEGFMYLMRFVLDRSIDILETETTSDKAMKSCIFAGQLIVLLILLYFIVSLIILPVIYFVLIFVYKIFRAAGSAH